MKHRSAVLPVLVGGFIAGTLDILFAISFAYYRGMAPVPSTLDLLLHMLLFGAPIALAARSAWVRNSLEKSRT